MNLEICKKCFKMNNNVIKYIYYDDSRNLLWIIALIEKSARDEAKQVNCHISLDEETSFELRHILNQKYFFSESEQKELLSKIEKPSNDCIFCCEHFLSELYSEKE